MRTAAERRGGRQLRGALPQRPADHVVLPRQGVAAVAERCRVLRLHQRLRREYDVDEVVVPLVEQDVGVVHHDEVHADVDLEHALRQHQVDRPGRLRRGAGPVEHRLLALPIVGELHPERTVAEPVVVDVVLEARRLFGNVLFNQALHGAPGPLEQRVGAGDIGIPAEPIAQLRDPGLGQPHGCRQGHHVGHVHVGEAGIARQDVENRLVERAGVVQLDRREPDPLLEDGRRRGRHAARDGGADVGQVAEDRPDADELVLVEQRSSDQEVGRVLDRAGAEVGVVLDDDVARAQLLAGEVVEQRRAEIPAELADDHPALRVRDQRKGVVLLADDRRHRGPEDDRVHFPANALQCVLDEVDGDGIDRAVVLGPRPVGRAVHFIPPGRSGCCRGRRPRLGSLEARASWSPSG